MKIFIIASLALAAVVYADNEVINKKDRMEEFQNKKNEIREKWISMTEEEREKIRAEHRDKMVHHPVHHFKEIPEEVRQKIHDKIASLSPEERQKIRDRFQHHTLDIAVPYNTEDAVKISAPIRSRFPNLTEEDKQKIRENFMKLTPEQREEIRKHHQRNPTLSGPVPVPAAADGDFEKIRTPHEDIMIKVQPDRRNPRFPVLPAAANSDFEAIRKPEDDIMIQVNPLDVNGDEEVMTEEHFIEEVMTEDEFISLLQANKRKSA